MKKIFYMVLIFNGTMNFCFSQNSGQVPSNSLPSLMEKISGKISFQVWQYDNVTVKQKHIITAIDNESGSLEIENSLLKYKITENIVNKDKSINFKINFRLESGEMKSSEVAVVFDFDKWSTDNYLLIPAAAYNGNRFRSIPVQYPPMFYGD